MRFPPIPPTVLFALTAGLFPACGFDPQPKNGVVPCSVGCPSNYYCAADKTCWPNGTGPSSITGGSTGSDGPVRTGGTFGSGGANGTVTTIVAASGGVAGSGVGSGGNNTDASVPTVDSSTTRPDVSPRSDGPAATPGAGSDLPAAVDATIDVSIADLQKLDTPQSDVGPRPDRSAVMVDDGNTNADSVANTGAGTFASTESLAGARGYHTATPLPNGKILMVGGIGGNLASAELYDPAARTFTPTGSLNSARSSHTATLLATGKVLVTGGCNNPNYLASAELYDPSTGTFTWTGSLSTARADHTASLLPNGMVLIVGGYNGSTLGTAELYDPSTGTFSLTGPLTNARGFHTATLLPNDKVLIVGWATSAELYEPSTGAFTLTGSLGTARYSQSATLLPNGKVLIAGGVNGSASIPSAEIYDPATGTFTATTSMASSRASHTATLLQTGKVLVAGGLDGNGPAPEGRGNTLTTAELYDPGVGTFTATGPLSSARFQHTATLLQSGMVLMAGGWSGSEVSGVYSGSYLASTELYDPVPAPTTLSILPISTDFGTGGQGTFTFTITNAGTTSAGVVAAIVIAGASDFSISSGTCINATLPAGSSCTLAVGFAPGSGGKKAGSLAVSASAASTLSASLSGTGLLSSTTTTFTSTKSLGVARGVHTATLLANGKVLLTGGISSSYLASAELYDPATGSFTLTGSLATGRIGHTATLLPASKVLITGGTSDGQNYLASAEVYDPATGTFAITGSLASARAYHTSTLLSNGKVLIVGGYSGGYLASAELYDPATGIFTLTGSLPTATAHHTATLLSNGKVLIASGLGTSDKFLPNAELYDPTTGTFTATGSLAAAREDHTATLLSNGKVLIAAGWGGTGSLSSCEVYDPVTGAFTATGPLSTARWWHTSTLLQNGKVVVAGGMNGFDAGGLGSTLMNAETYAPETGTFTATASMISSRFEHTATLLANGIVLLAGGYSGTVTSSWAQSGNYLASGELYGPVPGQATLTISPISMDFGSVAVGSSSPAQSFTLVNTGSVATGAPVLTLLGANPGDFAIAAQSCTGSLAPGAACWTKIVFQPTSAATIRSATLTVTDGTTTGAVAASLLGTGSGSPGTGGAGGTGAGGSSASGGAGGAPMGGTGGETGGSGGAGGTAAAALSIYPNSVDYGIVAVGGTSSVQAFTVTNVGNATIGTFSVALSGSSTGEFVISGSTCISVLPVASSCAVAMVFEPNSTGAKSATLVVAGDTATATASLLGIGVSPP